MSTIDLILILYKKEGRRLVKIVITAHLPPFVATDTLYAMLERHQRGIGVTRDKLETCKKYIQPSSYTRSGGHKV